MSAVASPDGGWWLRWKGHPLSRCPHTLTHTLPWCPHTPAPLSWCPTPLLPTVPSYYLYSSLRMASVLAAYTPAIASLGAVLDGKVIMVFHLVLPGLFPYSHLEPVSIWKKVVTPTVALKVKNTSWLVLKLLKFGPFSGPMLSSAPVCS